MKIDNWCDADNLLHPAVFQFRRPSFPWNQLHKHMRLLFVPEGVNNDVIAKSVVLGRKSTLDKSVSMFPEESMSPHEQYSWDGSHKLIRSWNSSPTDL